jgi:hypothetical protein
MIDQDAQDLADILGIGWLHAAGGFNFRLFGVPNRKISIG